MCVAIPAQVIEIINNEAIVNYGGVKMSVDISLIEDLKIGDYVLVHAGCAMQKIDDDEAQKTLELFKLLGEYEG
jgi:hydrogenase expression/formation protein HypC